MRLLSLALFEIDREAQTATTLYEVGAIALVLGAVAALGVGIVAAVDSLDRWASFDPTATVAVLLGVAFAGLVAILTGVGFDVDSSIRRARWRASD
jgi:hypothetical protein